MENKRQRLDPVHQNQDGLWYFWDEVWADEYGPYGTEVDCRKALNKYCENI